MKRAWGPIVFLLLGASVAGDDEFTLYELLGPDSHRFAITYDVAAEREGDRYFLNPIREGSIVTDERVVDRATGKPLRWEIVTGKQARAAGLLGERAFGRVERSVSSTRDAGSTLASANLEDSRAAELARIRDDESRFVKVELSTPVPKDGARRIRIFKTYADPKSYYPEGDRIVFDRGLSIRRNAVVLPAGYELVACSVPAIVSTEADGRVKASFVNDRDDVLPVKIVGRRLPAAGGAR
jgi:hypothetical protein